MYLWWVLYISKEFEYYTVFIGIWLCVSVERVLLFILRMIILLFVYGDIIYWAMFNLAQRWLVLKVLVYMERGGGII